MRVALDARYLNAPGSGIGSYNENLLQNLLALDPSVRFLLVTRKPGLANHFDPNRCDEMVFRAPPRSYRTIHALGSALRRHDVDLFHSPFNILPRRLRAPSVVTIHDVIPLQDLNLISRDVAFQLGAGRFWRKHTARAIRSAHRIVTISQASKQSILELFDDVADSRVVVAPNGVDPYFTEPSDPAGEAALVKELLGGLPPYVLCVGQASPRKNHARAIEAFLEAFDENSSMRMVLVRRIARPDARMKALLARSDVRERVITLDYVGRPSLRALYRQARMFFFPSYAEGFGLPLLEAMASQCPVVTSDRSALSEVAGDAAVLCSPFRVSEMSAALRRVDRDEALRQDLIARGEKRLGYYTYSRCAAITLDVYRELVTARVAPHQAFRAP